MSAQNGVEKLWEAYLASQRKRGRVFKGEEVENYRVAFVAGIEVCMELWKVCPEKARMEYLVRLEEDVLSCKWRRDGKVTGSD